MTVQFAGADYIVIVREANVLGCETGAGPVACRKGAKND